MGMTAILRRLPVCRRCRNFSFYDVLGQCHCELADVLSEVQVAEYSVPEYEQLEVPKGCPYQTEQVIFQKQ